MLSDTPHGPTRQRHSNPLNAYIDPLAVSAYIGDLYAIQLLPVDMLKACIAFLVNRVRTPAHLRCVEHLLNHANSSQITPRLEACFLLTCLGAIQRYHRYTKHTSPVSCTDSPILLIFNLF